MYSMSLFQLPKGLIHEIQRLSNRFWWGSDAKKHRIHWCAWEWLSPKSEGGLGFRNLEISNRALLANQCWRLLKNPNSLATRILKGCYYKDCGLLDAPNNSRASFIWKSLVWEQHFLLEDMELILKIPTGPSWSADTMLWHYERNDKHSVKSCYWLGCKMAEEPGTSNATSLTQWWNFLLKMNVASKIKIFIWRACFDWIPTSANLARPKVSANGKCLVCNDAVDSTLHALWNYKSLKAIRAE
ncbi:hypothetical protein Ddye_025926 [Dipteronia dyeriana]|uniref:Reverse transcriptase zinc-binding domain-containing protein n=1 Tax=Dipteronia dyeriana TaxID=168575 RepID=A0AAD9WNZ7_9ROSI|nr:hypothetical protein Ddye_025926 [Dipteronia dyeriana]